MDALWSAQVSAQKPHTFAELGRRLEKRWRGMWLIWERSRFYIELWMRYCKFAGREELHFQHHEALRIYFVMDKEQVWGAYLKQCCVSKATTDE